MTEPAHKTTHERRRPRRLMLWLLLGLILTIVTGFGVLRYRYRVWMQHVAIIKSQGGSIDLTSSAPAWLDRLEPDDGFFGGPVADPLAPNWVRRLIPLDTIRRCFHSVERVEFGHYSGQHVISNTSGAGDVIDGRDADLSASILGHLQRFPRIRKLNLRGTKVDDDSLAGLRDVTSLRWLSLEDTAITSDGLKHLSNLTNLEELLLEDTLVTDAGLKHLEPLSRLRRLDLQSTKITDAGLESIGKLTQLEVLDLSYTQIRGTQLQELAQLQELKWLDLQGTDVGDAGLAGLASLENLRFLFVSSSHLTPEGVKPLSGLRDLKVLRVGYLSDEEIDDLRGLFSTIDFTSTDVFMGLDFGRYEDLLGSLDDPGFNGGGWLGQELDEENFEAFLEVFRDATGQPAGGEGNPPGGGGFF